MMYLKPCPFCGADASHLRQEEWHLVGCYHPECGVRPEVLAETQKTAASIWNRRTATFDMDGTHHFVGNPNCCRTGYICNCGGIVHYQPMYGGYDYRCDKCGSTTRKDW